MKLLRFMKRVRSQLAKFARAADTAYGCCELLSGAAVSIFTGRVAPRLPGSIVELKALIVCPSPLLNSQAINWDRRGDYIITFVNSSCLSPQFLFLRPERFFLIDPIFFQELASVSGYAAAPDGIQQTVSRLLEVTVWPMTVYVPWHYRNSPNSRRLAANPNITVCGLPIFNARGRNQFLKQLGFDFGILNPIYQNVLIAAIFFNLKAGHRRVLCGARTTTG